MSFDPANKSSIFGDTHYVDLVGSPALCLYIVAKFSFKTGRCGVAVEFEVVERGERKFGTYSLDEAITKYNEIGEAAAQAGGSNGGGEG